MFDKITSRIQKLCYGLHMDFIDPVGFVYMAFNDLGVFFVGHFGLFEYKEIINISLLRRWYI